ncbi:glucose-6-phosphate isomerase [Glutamicibacter protophormiae]|uniref:glucose-6-phosphate isomerase n=1 Tax=Glutamicibacter protophormiae TaxID=37930 RepID=UPI002A80CA44|nr:glucose-6-phosphate isomerase [Glutamicibacter protophormiae]WPR63245.1 glucose-6-phosphate isomerase [Glutamicibacter protophormiae]WPR66741.1 glucose-6-phosphate isomerase [Glutamicibacter protophormiae]
MELGLVTSGDALKSVDELLPQLIEARIGSRIAAQDATIWGPAAEAESAIRLGWVNPFDAAQQLVPAILELRGQLQAEGLTRIVLCGMGGSSLAPEVIAAHDEVDLVICDTTDPAMLRPILATDLERTVVVVASKSGSTVETDSQRRAFTAAFQAAGIDPATRLVLVTDPGSPMDNPDGVRAVFNADPNVGGRYSALTAFGLVPTGLAGADIEALIEEAGLLHDVLATDDEDNLAFHLGAAMATAGRDKLVIAGVGDALPGFGDWAEQLIAESTGKDSKGVLPVVAHPGAPELRDPAADVLPLYVYDELPEEIDEEATAVHFSAPLGTSFMIFEYATAVAGYLLGISPFDQPDVEAAKVAARSLLDAPAASAPDAVDGPVELFGTSAVTLAGALDELAAALPDNGYLAVQAYLDRIGDSELEGLRDALASKTGRPVTFGWGPRFLHSTGQYHKGGPAQGVFLQLTADHREDLEIPGRPYSFGGLITAQASGDAGVLSDEKHHRPVLRVNLTDRAAGIAALLEAAK